MVVDIKEYILRSRESGISDNVIKTALVNMGHSRLEIEQVYTQILGVRATESENYFTPNNSIQFGNQPAVTSPEQLAQEAQDVEVGKKKTKNIVAIVAAVILILAGSGSGLAYYRFLQTKPENVLKKFNLAWPSIASFSSKANIVARVTPTADALNQIEFKAEFTGSFDFSTTTGPRTSGEIIISSAEFANFSPIGLSFVFIDKNAYLRSWDFSKFPLFDLSSLNGVWIKAGTNLEEYASSSPFGISADLSRANGAKQRFVEAMKTPPVNFIKELPSETINNVATYHYLFEIDKTKFEEFIGKIGDLTAEEIAKGREGIESRYPDVGTSTLELWVSKTNYMPAKISVLLENAGVGNFTDSVKIENTWSNINSQLNISEPNGTKNLQDIFEELAARFATNIETNLNSSSTLDAVSTSTVSTSTIPKR